jgi:preprotein translocase subunit SecE
MENRKIIIGAYLSASAIVWFMSRSLLQYLYLTFYQIRRLPGISEVREFLPVVLAFVTFLLFFRNARTNTVLEEVISELKKVTWPSRPDVVKSTTVVLICVCIASFVLAGFDFAWGKIIGLLIHS